MGMEEAVYIRKMVEAAVTEAINVRIPTKYYIYESGSFTVPYDTVARVIVVGKGGAASGNNGGGGGGTAVKIANLKKGQKINVTINDTSTAATYNDGTENWTITGNAGSGTAGGSASGGVQNISGGAYRAGNAISKAGGNGKNGSSTTYGGGASYFGGNGAHSTKTNESSNDFTGGNGGDGLYGGGNGGNASGRLYSSGMPVARGGNGGNSIYGYGGDGGNANVASTSDSYTAGYAVGGRGGYGGIHGGTCGKGTGEVLSESSLVEQVAAKMEYEVDGNHGIFQPLFAIPPKTPIGSGAGGNGGSPGVGAIIIELGESRLLDTYI